MAGTGRRNARDQPARVARGFQPIFEMPAQSAFAVSTFAGDDEKRAHVLLCRALHEGEKGRVCGRFTHAMQIKTGIDAPLLFA